MPSLAGAYSLIDDVAENAAEAEEFWRQKKEVAEKAEALWREVKESIEALRPPSGGGPSGAASEERDD